MISLSCITGSIWGTEVAGSGRIKRILQQECWQYVEYKFRGYRENLVVGSCDRELVYNNILDSSLTRPQQFASCELL